MNEEETACLPHFREDLLFLADAVENDRALPPLFPTLLFFSLPFSSLPRPRLFLTASSVLQHRGNGGPVSLTFAH